MQFLAYENFPLDAVEDGLKIFGVEVGPLLEAELAQKRGLTIKVGSV
ncbi:MAG TPA: hypothetical protein VGX70_21565 [Gemmataceae bacterium]|jgi:hypothetical protein|nr:hypothetical protein [Gemmataceae bacterium]